ncbi:universal stress protein [Halegenticoccus tardaugens]|uniref:universal stress protein n=1 Tax=Halegenticoccus tardaugens TaxID=2071624 RepID=UPI00100C1DB7|nr:universal stress protein [Halegenticoccus tardaugens]
MTLLVPFDGSALSEAALARATEFGGLMDEEVVALTVIPEDADYALERGWIGEAEPFDVETVEGSMRQRVSELAPEATFRTAIPQGDDPTATQAMDVARTVREVAADVGATIVFVGSENAGRVSAPLSSVGNPISEDPRYDVHIVRHAGR